MRPRRTFWAANVDTVVADVVAAVACLVGDAADEAGACSVGGDAGGVDGAFSAGADAGVDADGDFSAG